MADEGSILTDLGIDSDTQGAANGADNQPAAGIISQYVKDMSVENPNAPACYQWQEGPQLDVQFNIAAENVEGEVHEVELKIAVKATTGEGTAYLVELSYCGLIGMRNLPEEQQHAFLYTVPSEPRVPLLTSHLVHMQGAPMAGLRQSAVPAVAAAPAAAVPLQRAPFHLRSQRPAADAHTLPEQCTQQPGSCGA